MTYLKLSALVICIFVLIELATLLQPGEKFPKTSTHYVGLIVTSAYAVALVNAAAWIAINMLAP